MPWSVEMDDEWRYTLLGNSSDSHLIVDYIGAKYALVPKEYCIIRWNPVYSTDTAIPSLKFWTGDEELDPVFSSHDLYENKRIVILVDLDKCFCCRMTPRTDSYDDDRARDDGSSRSPMNDMLRTMRELEKKVRIRHNQCNHLMKKYQETLDRVERVGLEFWDFSERDLKSIFMESQDRTRFVSSTGTWILFGCDIREKPFSLDGWRWCEERCRLVPTDLTHLLDATEDDSLEAEVRRQNADREALRSSLDLKLSKSPRGTSSSKSWNPATWFGWRAGALVQGELESIWRKRLLASSCAPGSFSPLDAFVIDNPDTSIVPVRGSRSRSGASKSVQKCKWLGEIVALSAMSNVSKVFAQAETGFLARVQHPNVVEWMGFAFQEDLRDPNCYREFFLVTEHMECDLHDLITKCLTEYDGTISNSRPPFRFQVGVDIVLQIVEAMIHLHRCRVIHRDLKPKNILASRKYQDSYGPTYYTIKLIDFGSSKSGDQGSHSHTRKQGTPVYMAPEVWESEDSSSWSADAYSFGLTCFEIFTGRLPLESGMTLKFPNIQKVLRGEVSFPVLFPAGFKALIVKCWAQDPSDRPCFEDIRKALWRLKVLFKLEVLLELKYMGSPPLEELFAQP